MKLLDNDTFYFKINLHFDLGHEYLDSHLEKSDTVNTCV